jgi:hypothetical protein
MRELLAASDFEGLRILSHSLKGSGGSFGFPELTRIGGELDGKECPPAGRKRAAKCHERNEDVFEKVAVRDALRERRQQKGNADGARFARFRTARLRERRKHDSGGRHRKNLRNEQRLRVRKDSHERYEREQDPRIMNLEVRAVLRAVPGSAAVGFGGEPLHERPGVGAVAQCPQFVEIERDVNARE